MFLSEKTVEANLSRVYGKLDVRSRTELGRRLSLNADSRCGRTRQIERGRFHRDSPLSRRRGRA